MRFSKAVVKYRVPDTHSCAAADDPFRCRHGKNKDKL